MKESLTFTASYFFAGDRHLSLFYTWQRKRLRNKSYCVNALSGLYLISTLIKLYLSRFFVWVSMPSRAYTSFLPDQGLESWSSVTKLCQCPLGLIPHFYHDHLRRWCWFYSWCQCPLGLIPHFYIIIGIAITRLYSGVNALSGLYLISTATAR